MYLMSQLHGYIAHFDIIYSMSISVSQLEDVPVDEILLMIFIYNIL